MTNADVECIRRSFGNIFEALWLGKMALLFAMHDSAFVLSWVILLLKTLLVYSKSLYGCTCIEWWSITINELRVREKERADSLRFVKLIIMYCKL